MTDRISRRRVLQLGAAGTLSYLFTGPAVSVLRALGANDRLRVAGIGVGGKGWSDIEQAARVMDVVALCDIDEERAEQTRRHLVRRPRNTSTIASCLTR